MSRFGHFCAVRRAVVTASENASVPLALPDEAFHRLLPFQKHVRHPEQEYFADVSSKTSHRAVALQVAVVIRRNSTLTFQGER